MNDLKFRFYDPFNEAMIYSDEFDTISAFFFAHEKTITGGNKPSDVMQYTGQDDRDLGKIYQNDIVKNHWYNIHGKFIGDIWIVKYGGHSTDGEDYYTCGGYGFYYDNGDETHSIGNLASDEHILDEGGIEIIGNIHENPEKKL